MKMIMFLLTVCFLQSAIATNGQQVSIRVKNTPVKQVLYSLSQQSGYDFIYDAKLLNELAPVTLNLNKVSLKEALDKCFAEYPKEFYFNKDKTIVIKQKKANPFQIVKQQSITGRVVEENGETLVGVSVQIKGTRQGTVTNKDGAFQINARKGDVLMFSYIGFKQQEILIDNDNHIEVLLVKESGELGEVVIVAMGNQQTKRSITGAVATIQTKELKQSPVANLSNALAGRLPGLISVQTSGEPGNDAAALFIRGIGTYGNTGPLVVLDGLPRSSHDFNQIDANEIESVTILKDAASSALYGIQGANGVIVVTTKRGGANQEPLINFNAQYAIQEPVRLPKMLSAFQQAELYKELDRNTGQPERYSDNVMQIIKDGSEPFLYPNVNWFDAILKESSIQSQYNANISGSAKNVRYFISGSYYSQGTLLKHGEEFSDNYGMNTKFDRYNFRSNVDLDATKRLQIRVDLAGRLENQIYPSSGFNTIFNEISGRSPSAQPVFNPDGSIGAGSNLEIPFRANPYGMVTRNGYFTGYSNTMNGTISAKHDLDFITKGLNAQMYFSFLNSNYKHTSRTQNFDSFWYQGEDNSGDVKYQQIGIKSFLSTAGGASIERHNYLDFRLKYDRNIGDHSVAAQVLGNRTLKLINDELPYAYQGVSGHFTYGYKSKYYAEVNLGYNGSENFPKGRRYGFFPAFSAGWILNEETLLKDAAWLGLLKIRGSYGLVGNDKIGGARWLYISDFATGGGHVFGITPSGVPGYNENRVGNAFVTWERSEKTNFGFDMELFKNNAVQLTVDVFREKRENILTPPGNVPAYVGIWNLAARNSGVVQNEGFEAELKLNHHIGKLRLFTNIQLTYAKNKVLQNDQPKPAFDYQDLNGYSVGYVLGYKTSGYFRDLDDIANSPKQTFSDKVIPGDIKYLDYNKDGVINTADRVPIQIQNMPTYVGGVSVGGSYKGFDFSVLFNGAKGGTSYVSMYPGSPLFLDRWTPNNQDARVPVANNSVNNLSVLNDKFIQKTDYLKIRNAEVGFELPKKLLSGIKVKYARFYVNGQNLHTWDTLWLKDRDPEAPSGALKYPILRITNFGVNVKF
ncbi:TonB-dependent receptor [Pedobacter immunditicola]|uniref:TonB-dependent receptor n=1 Tax=Pedobacter immunditicola TaxID=3133440 RepID=UPI003099687B